MTHLTSEFPAAIRKGDCLYLAWAGYLILLLSIGANPAAAQAVSRQETAKLELPKPPDDPPNFNWYFRTVNGGDRRENGAQQAMWEPLFLFNYDTGKLDPWLALSLEPDAAPKPEDEKVWTLKLRDKVFWSDGQPFNADDVVYTATMALENDGLWAVEAKKLREWVVSVTKVDNLTVKFNLRAANPRFALETFGSAGFGSFLIMPKHIWKDVWEPGTSKTIEDIRTFRFAKPIGTGPYKFKEISGSPKTVVWVRDENWWGARPRDPAHPQTSDPVFRYLPEPKELDWVAVPDLGQSKMMLRQNDLDAGRPYALEDFNDVKNGTPATAGTPATTGNPNVIGWSDTSPAWNDPCARQLDINTKRAPWDDPNVRKALSLLIDRTVLARDAYGGATVPSQTMFAQYGALQPFIDELKPYWLSPTAAPPAADTALKAAGYSKDVDGSYKKGDVPLEATILSNADVATDVTAAKNLKDQLDKLGVKTTVETAPDGDYWVKYVPKGDFEIVYGWLSCGSVATPFTSMRRYAQKAVPLGDMSPGRDNNGRWDTPAANAYADIVTNKIGPLHLGDPNVLPLVKDAYQYLAAEMPFIPLVQSPTIVPFSTKYWAGWPTEGGDTVPRTDWAATMRSIHELTASKCVRFFRPLKAAPPKTEMNGMKFDVVGGARLDPDGLGRIDLGNRTILISFDQNDRPLKLSVQAKAAGKFVEVTGFSDAGATLFSSKASAPEVGAEIPTNAARQIKLTGDASVLLKKVCFAD